MNHKTPVVKIRWVTSIPPPKGGSREVSLDGGITWNGTTQKKVNKLTDTKLVVWN